jgi:hypothetical protein
MLKAYFKNVLVFAANLAAAIFFITYIFPVTLDFSHLLASFVLSFSITLFIIAGIQISMIVGMIIKDIFRNTPFINGFLRINITFKTPHFYKLYYGRNNS